MAGPHLASLLISTAISAFGLPLGLPPAPEDPLLARIAPAECAVYLSWAGTAAPQPGSGNSFEQFLLDKEVIRSGTEIERVLTKLVEHGVVQTPEDQQPLVRKFVGVARSLLKQPGAIFVQIAPREKRIPPEVRVGIVLKAGEQAEALKELINHGLKQAPPGALETIEIDGRKFHRNIPQGDVSRVTGGFVGQYFILGYGPKVVEGILERAKQAPPQWLIDAQRRMAVARRASIAMVDLRVFLKLAGAPGDDELRVLKQLGIDRPARVESVTGLEGNGIVSRTLVQFDGPRAGLLRLLDGPGVTMEDFKSLPANTMNSYVVQYDAPAIYDYVLSLAQHGVGPEDFLPPELGKFKETTGIDLRREFLPALGNKVRIWTAPQALPTAIPTVMASIDIKDRKVVQKFVDKLPELIPQQDPRVSLRKEMIGEVATYQLQTQGPTGALTVWWGVLADKFVIANRPRLLREQIERPADFQSVGDSPELAAALKSNPKASLVIYEDTSKIYKFLYNLIGVGIPFAVQAAPPQFTGDLSLDLLPDPESIAKVIKPSITTVGITADGLEFQSRTSAPLVSSTSLMPVAVALLLPAVQSARGAARRMTSANNMKQIGLALHNYHSAHGKFPPAFSVDKNGKPLHSWRTLILPYIEQQAIYDKLKLDEPWDSAHNLPIVKDVVIQVYNSPAHAASSKTTYQTIRTRDSVFPDSNGVPLAKIKDGASNTVIVVETSLEKGVEWYKPDDYVPDEKKPVAGLRGPWPNVFLAGFADGSVRFISDAIPAESFRLLTDKADGKPIRTQDLEGPAPGGAAESAENLQPDEPETAPPPAIEPLPKGEDDPAAPNLFSPSTP